MKITAERERCIGAGLCVLTAPDVFEHDDDEGLVVVLEGEPSAEHHKDVRLAEELCPAHAIRIAAGTPVPPA